MRWCGSGNCVLYMNHAKESYYIHIRTTAPWIGQETFQKLHIYILIVSFVGKYCKQFLCFWRSWVRASKIYSNIYRTRYNSTQSIYIRKLLYMFRVVLPPIIKSAYNYLSRASGICHTVTAICRYRGGVGTGLSVLWVAYATHRFQLFHVSGR
jgi:uncharacterized membrane protein